MVCITQEPAGPVKYDPSPAPPHARITIKFFAGSATAQFKIRYFLNLFLCAEAAIKSANHHFSAQIHSEIAST
jgi:hypothetical protein